VGLAPIADAVPTFSVRRTEDADALSVLLPICQFQQVTGELVSKQDAAGFRSMSKAACPIGLASGEPSECWLPGPRCTNTVNLAVPAATQALSTAQS
jgi:hypothetical protein